MRRLNLTPRHDWLEKIASLGIDLAANPASPYWREDAAYSFTESEIETLEESGHELLSLILAAIGHVIDKNRFAELGISPPLAALATRSWRASEPSLYGRFDLRYDGTSPPKLLEYNADTPTALFEASVVQWHWLEERFPAADQFNSIHEALIESWTQARRSGRLGRVHFACIPEDDDDLLTTSYLMDTAFQAGLDTRLLSVPEIGWDGRHFLDLEESRIEALFKLYPWDWLANERFFPDLAMSKLKMYEPAWRVIPASKGILPILWELFPDHPNLLPSAFRAERIAGPRILKPLLGREGANIVIDAAGNRSATDGPYADMATIAQAFAPLPDFDGWRPVLGLWTVGGAPHGLGIREDQSAITGRGARFVPHVMEG